jgi:hypothetical protein
MRGSLNVGYRKHEMIRINQGNRKILDQLKQVKPSVGTLDQWKKHELKGNHLKKHIKGMHLEKTFKSKQIDRTSAAPQSFTDSKVPVSQNSSRRPRGKLLLPKLGEN